MGPARCFASAASRRPCSTGMNVRSTRVSSRPNSAASAATATGACSRSTTIRSNRAATTSWRAGAISGRSCSPGAQERQAWVRRSTPCVKRPTGSSDRGPIRPGSMSSRPNSIFSRPSATRSICSPAPISDWWRSVTGRRPPTMRRCDAAARPEPDATRPAAASLPCRSSPGCEVSATRCSRCSPCRSRPPTGPSNCRRWSVTRSAWPRRCEALRGRRSLSCKSATPSSSTRPRWHWPRPMMGWRQREPRPSRPPRICRAGGRSSPKPRPPSRWRCAVSADCPMPSPTQSRFRPPSSGPCGL